MTLKPEVRLFLSADIVGSSVYKAEMIAGDVTRAIEWSESISGFFRDFPALFQRHADARALGSGCDPMNSVWKLLGDEILFVFDVTDFAQTTLLCAAFFDALVEYDQDLARGPLRLKGLGWLAQFPFPNVEVRAGARSGQRADYIGPDMDIGFRLADSTRAGRFLISIELAEQIADQPPTGNLVIHHVGWSGLRGINGGKPYPVFWARDPVRSPSAFNPWDTHTCELTRHFLAAPPIAADAILDLGKRFRAAVRPWRPARPYLDIAHAPAEHREAIALLDARSAGAEAGP
ncbi:nucleotidyl cyclase domain-containing protein [Geminicoccus roseus]|uniref:hypothetical protein n=1 Tax=Geminicoccus roseus TaxID=404900 RepID=UPI0004054E0D|nr:hypothetical protein [Geminicoccus roseus]